MDNLGRFVGLAEKYGEDAEVFIEMPDGALYEVFGIRPTDKHGALMITLSPSGNDPALQYTVVT